MNAVNVSKLDTTQSILTTDKIHLLRTNDYSIYLSYKSSASNLLNIFANASAIDDFKKQINTAMSELETLSATMLLKSDGDARYIKKDTIDAKLPALVTNTAFTTELSKYPTSAVINAKRQELYAEARRMADEMTDFTGAAMVGINQSNASYQSSEEENDDEKKKKD